MLHSVILRQLSAREELKTKILGMQPHTKASSYNLNFPYSCFDFRCAGETQLKTEKCMEKFKL